MKNKMERHAAALAGSYRLVTVNGASSAELGALVPLLGEAAAAAVGAGVAPPTILILRPRPHALLGPKDVRLPHVAAGVEVLREAGLPVFRRAAGGTAVVVDDGSLIFAVARPCRDFVAIRRNFEEMTVGVRLALRRMGLEAEFGEAPGAFCAGPYDLMVNGRKIAGVAQTVRRGVALVSGVLLVSQDPRPATELLNRFYAAAGGAPDLTTDHVTTVSELLGRLVSMEEVEAALAAGFAEAHGWEPGVLTDAELATARRLVSERRLD